MKTYLLNKSFFLKLIKEKPQITPSDLYHELLKKGYINPLTQKPFSYSTVRRSILLYNKGTVRNYSVDIHNNEVEKSQLSVDINNKIDLNSQLSVNITTQLLVITFKKIILKEEYDLNNIYTKFPKDLLKIYNGLYNENLHTLYIVIFFYDNFKSISIISPTIKQIGLEKCIRRELNRFFMFYKVGGVLGITVTYIPKITSYCKSLPVDNNQESLDLTDSIISFVLKHYSPNILPETTKLISDNNIKNDDIKEDILETNSIEKSDKNNYLEFHRIITTYNPFIETSLEGYNIKQEFLSTDKILSEITKGDDIKYEFFDIILYDKKQIFRRFKDILYILNINNNTLTLEHIEKSYRLPNITIRNEYKHCVKSYGVLDIETYFDGNNMIPYAVGIYLGEDDFKYSILSKNNNNIFESILNELFKTTKTIIYAHNGANFDFYYLIWNLPDSYNIDEKTLNSGKLTSLTISNGKKKIQFKDSYQLLSENLRSLSKKFEKINKGYFPYKYLTKDNLNYIGPKPSIEYFSDINLEEYNKIPNKYNIKKECIKYLEIDCKTLYHIIQAFQDEIYLRSKMDITKYSSISLLSNAIWRYMDSSLLGDVKSIPANSSLIYIFRMAFFGGINDYKLYQSYDHNVILDVNSMYPYAMSKKLPVGNPTFKTEKNIENYYGIIYVKVNTNNINSIGLAPVRVENKIIYPNGKFEGWYWSEEVKSWIQHGYTVDVMCGFHFPDSRHIFTNFINTFYKLKSEGAGYIKLTAKLILNSAFGILGLRSYNSLDKDFLKEYLQYTFNIKTLVNKNTSKESDKKTSNNESNDDRNSNITNISLAVAIAANSRIKLNEMRIKYNYIYCDTDSIVVPYKDYLDIKERGLIDNKELGAWKEEAHCNYFGVLRKKAYGFLDSKGIENLTLGGVSSQVNVPLQAIKDLINNKISFYPYKFSFFSKNSDNKVFIQKEMHSSLNNKDNSHMIIYDFNNIPLYTMPLNIIQDDKSFLFIHPNNKLIHINDKPVTPYDYTIKEVTILNNNYKILIPNNIYHVDWSIHNKLIDYNKLPKPKV